MNVQNWKSITVGFKGETYKYQYLKEDKFDSAEFKLTRLQDGEGNVIDPNSITEPSFTFIFLINAKTILPKSGIHFQPPNTALQECVINEILKKENLLSN